MWDILLEIKCDNVRDNIIMSHFREILLPSEHFI